MDVASRELLVARICSGTVRLTLRGRTYVVRRPTRDQIYRAAEIYHDMFRQSELDGVYSDDELMEFLIEQELWDEEREKLFETLPKEMEEFKVQLYKATFKSSERKVIRAALATAKSKWGELARERAAYTHLSCSGTASVAKARYLVAVGLHTQSGRPVFADEDFWEAGSDLLDSATQTYAESAIDEASFRLVARTEPWRSIWSANKSGGSVFGMPVVDYTDEQKALVNWSGLYESVYQHPECPADAVIEDDDLFDGWLICQRRERDARMNQKEGDDLLKNEKIRNSQEIYLVAETVDDARKVVEKNDQFGKAIQKQRFTVLKNKGEVNEVEMPDTKQRLRMEMTQKLSQEMAAKRG